MQWPWLALGWAADATSPHKEEAALAPPVLAKATMQTILAIEPPPTARPAAPNQKSKVGQSVSQ